MTKSLEFTDFTANVKDSDGDRHKSVVSAAVVTEDTVREVRTLSGGRVVVPGDVVIATGRPDVFDVLSADQWANTGYGSRTVTPVDSVPPTPGIAPANQPSTVQAPNQDPGA